MLWKKMAFTPVRTPLSPKYRFWLNVTWQRWQNHRSRNRKTKQNLGGQLFYSRKGGVAKTSASSATCWFTRSTVGKGSTTIYWEQSPRTAAQPAEPDLIRWGDNAATLWGVPRAPKVLPRCSLGEVPPPDSGESSSDLQGTLTFCKMEYLILPCTFKKITASTTKPVSKQTLLQSFNERKQLCLERTQGGGVIDGKHALHCRGTKYPRSFPSLICRQKMQTWQETLQVPCQYLYPQRHHSEQCSLCTQ